jgi:hypothetical protein
MPQISRTALVHQPPPSFASARPPVLGYRCSQAGNRDRTSHHLRVDTSVPRTDNQSILMSLVDGPFKKLIGGWKFIPLSPDACKIEFHLDFEFTNTSLARVVNACTILAASSLKMRPKAISISLLVNSKCRVCAAGKTVPATREAAGWGDGRAGDYLKRHSGAAASSLKMRPKAISISLLVNSKSR